jgi:hypothetical protein
MADDSSNDASLRTALKRVAVALKQAEIPFALAGGYAAWARGAPEPGHDVDFYLAQGDVEAAEDACRHADLRVERPPEDWLTKVYDGDAMVDLIFAPTGMTVDGDVLGRAGEVEVDSVRVPVLSATDLLVSKLLALSEHYCDFGSLLPAARALREQVDWAHVRQVSADNAFAQAFLQLADDLDLTA